MGHYIIPLEEFLPLFEQFLQEVEGDVTAEVMAEAWNMLSEQYGWGDYLSVG